MKFLFKVLFFYIFFFIVIGNNFKGILHCSPNKKEVKK